MVDPPAHVYVCPCGHHPASFANAASAPVLLLLRAGWQSGAGCGSLDQRSARTAGEAARLGAMEGALGPLLCRPATEVNAIQ